VVGEDRHAECLLQLTSVHAWKTVSRFLPCSRPYLKDHAPMLRTSVVSCRDCMIGLPRFRAPPEPRKCRRASIGVACEPVAGTDRNSRPMWTEYRIRCGNAAFAAGKCPPEEALERWRALQDSNLRPSDS